MGLVSVAALLNVIGKSLQSLVGEWPFCSCHKKKMTICHGNAAMLCISDT